MKFAVISAVCIAAVFGVPVNAQKSIAPAHQNSKGQQKSKPKASHTPGIQAKTAPETPQPSDDANLDYVAEEIRNLEKPYFSLVRRGNPETPLGADGLMKPGVASSPAKASRAKLSKNEKKKPTKTKSSSDKGKPKPVGYPSKKKPAMAKESIPKPGKPRHANKTMSAQKNSTEETSISGAKYPGPQKKYGFDIPVEAKSAVSDKKYDNEYSPREGAKGLDEIGEWNGLYINDPDEETHVPAGEGTLPTTADSKDTPTTEENAYTAENSIPQISPDASLTEDTANQNNDSKPETNNTRVNLEEARTTPIDDQLKELGEIFLPVLFPSTDSSGNQVKIVVSGDNLNTDPALDL